MVGIEPARDGARIGGLVEGRVFETDREGLETTGKVTRGERRDRARVDPPREEDAQRHVAHEVLPHREVEHGTQRLHRVGLAHRAVALEADVPVRLDLHAAVRIREPVAGRELADPTEDRVRCRDVLVGEVA